MTIATNSGPVTCESDFSWYDHSAYEEAIQGLPIRGERGRIKVLRVQEKCFPERLIKEVNFLWDNGLDPKELVEKHCDPTKLNKTRADDKKWPGISAIVINDDPLNNWVFVIEFPDGSPILSSLKPQSRNSESRAQRLGLSATIWRLISPERTRQAYSPCGTIPIRTRVGA